VIAALLLLLAQTPTGPERPVRVWLGSSSPLVRGAPVRVYVQTREDGYLVVLRARTDGRIEVLFPADPTAEPFVRAGTYEIRRATDGEAFVVLEPDGTGMVLAALSPGSLRVDEFARQADWNPDALAPSWPGADREGALTDVVQRMAGDGYFNYDFVTYTVAPPSYVLQEAVPLSPELPSCLGCSFVNVTLFVPEAVVACDPLFAPCFGVPIARRHRPFCGSRLACPDRGTTVAAVGATVVPLFSRSGLNGLVVPPRPRAIPVIGPRIRVPDRRSRERAAATAGAVVRRRPVSAPARRVVRPWVPPSSGGGAFPLTGTVQSTETVLPLTGTRAELRAPVGEEPRSTRWMPATSGLVAVPRGAAVTPVPARTGFPVTAARPQAVAQPLLPVRASPGMGAAGQMRGFAPTGSAWQGVVARTLRTAGRRH